MKKIIITGFLAFSCLAYGQNFNPCVNPTDAAYSPANGSVAIGPTAPTYKLHVTDNDGNPGVVAGYFDYTATSVGGGAYVGIRGGASSSGILSSNTGVLGLGTGALVSNVASISYGVFGQGSGGGINYGGYFSGAGSTAASGGKNIGVYGTLINGAAAAGINAGVYGDDGGNGSGTYAGYFSGDVYVNGSGVYTGTWLSSDKRFKKNLVPLSNVTEKIQKLNGYTYSFKTNEFKEKHFDDKTHIGFIAQELKEVFPELVKEDAMGFYAVDYQGMIPVLLEAIKEQQKKLDGLSLVLQKQNENKEGNTTGIGLNKESIGFGLEQNIPNPYTHETVINYSLPEQTNQAYLAVYDLSGKQLATLQLTQMGKSSITITSEKLVAGIYIYSIMADGKVLDSKRMIVADK